MFITLFIIFLVIFCLCVVAQGFSKYGSDGAIVGMVINGIGIFAMCVGGSIDTVKHTDDLGTIRAYSSVIAVQEQRVAELKNILSTKFDVTKSEAMILLNADSPIATVVKALAEANTDLAQARRQVALASVSIARRKAGPMWFIVSIYGEK